MQQTNTAKDNYRAKKLIHQFLIPEIDFSNLGGYKKKPIIIIEPHSITHIWI